MALRDAAAHVCRSATSPPPHAGGSRRGAAALPAAAGAALLGKAFLEEGDHVTEHLRPAVAAAFLAQAHLALDPQLVHALFQEEAETRMMDAGIHKGEITLGSQRRKSSRR